MFTIDSDLNITYWPDPVPGGENVKQFSSRAELAAILRDQTRPQLADIWNTFAGVGQFSHLRPVKAFTHSPQDAIRRIWEAIQCLRDGSEATEAEPEPEVKARKPRKTAAKAQKNPASKPKRQKRGRTGTPLPMEPRQGTKRGQVMAMISRQKGATLTEIMGRMGWQRHTVRGFVSTLGSKYGFKTTSERTDGDVRYRAA